MKESLAWLISVLALAGCATNPYSQFYHDYTGEMGMAGSAMLVEPETEPVVRQGSDPAKDGLEMMRNGYVIIGESSFNAGPVSAFNAKIHARRVGAEIALLYSQYTDTVSGSAPLTLPDTKTSTTYGSASAYGPGGSVNAYGSSHTTTYGTKTTYIPYNVRRYDYIATFWTRTKPLAFGVNLRDLTDQQRRHIQSNKGASVYVVMKGSPAFENDVLEGDIIRKVNETNIIDAKHCLQIIADNKGKTINVMIIRDGQEIEKQIKLND